MLEPMSRFVECLAHSAPAENRQAVTRHENLCLASAHRAERLRPVSSVALHLLRVSGVGGHPDELVAREEHLAFRPEDPGMVVCFPARVTQLQSVAAGVQLEAFVVRHVGIVELCRPWHRYPKLPCIDGGIVAGGRAISIKTWTHVLVTDDPYPLPVFCSCLGQERRKTKGMVYVTMRIDARKHWSGVTVTYSIEGLRPSEVAPGIDQDEPGRRAGNAYIGERVEKEKIPGDFFPRSTGVPVLVVATLPSAFSQIENIAHRVSLSSTPAGIIQSSLRSRAIEARAGRSFRRPARIGSMPATGREEQLQVGASAVAMPPRPDPRGTGAALRCRRAEAGAAG